MIPDYFGYEDNFKKYKNVKSNLIVEGKIKNPKITIAIPTYKRVRLLKEALLSVINQKEFDDYNIIVVDNDDSNTEEVKNMILDINSEKVSYYKNEKNIGMFGNWNRCIELADGEYLSILNDDDWLEENYLIEIANEIKDKICINTLVNVKYGNNNQPLKKMKLKSLLYRIKKRRKFKIEDFFFSARNTGSLGILYFKKNLIELGGFNELYYPTADTILHANYCYRYGAIRLNKELVNYRIEVNESLNLDTRKGFVEVGKNFREYLIKLLEKGKIYKFLNKVITENRRIENKVIVIEDGKCRKKYLFFKTLFMLREYFKEIFN